MSQEADGGSWKVALSARAQRDLARLPPRIATAVVEFVTGAMTEQPTRLSRPLSGGLSGVRSARRGDYRILFEVRSDQRLLLVVRIAHRAHVYRPE